MALRPGGFVGGVVLIGGCPAGGGSGGTLSGEVSNATTGAALAGAAITLDPGTGLAKQGLHSP